MRSALPPQLTAVLALGALAACAHHEPPPREPLAGPTAADRHRIAVVQAGERLEIPVGVGDVTLTAETRAAIEGLAQRYRARGHGPVLLSTPSGGSASDAAARLSQEARLHLATAGVSPAAIAASTYDASGSPTAPIVVTFSFFEAEAPDCAPLYTQNLAANRSTPWSSFGCAQAANLAAMIDDPRDLQGPRTEDPRDAARRAVVLDKYRQGEPTGATRSNDEAVAVSEAVR